MKIFLINFYIDKNRSPHNGDETLMWPIYLAKKNEVYVYQGIKNINNIKDGKVCKINNDGTNIIIEGDPNNKKQKPGNHSYWIYPNKESKLINIILNLDVIIILGKLPKLTFFLSHIKKSKAFVIQQPIYSKKLPFSNYILNNNSFCRVISQDNINIIKNFRNNNKKNIFNLGMVGTLCIRKGQLNFLKKINSKKLDKYIIHIVGPVMDKKYLREIKNICNKKKIKYKIHGKLNGVKYFKLLCSFKCIIHFSYVDANPRVIWESIYCGVPYFASSKCQIPKIIHKFGIISDNVNDIFKLLEKDYKDEINNFSDKKLSPEIYVNNLIQNIYSNRILIDS